jgi:DsbC/DsbD-like thiol-disulfide interchange protein
MLTDGLRYHQTMLPLILILGLSIGVPQRPTDVVKWTATASADEGAGTVKVLLTATIQSGWKLYALTQPKGGPKPLAIDVADGAPFTIAKKQIVAPKPKTLKDENFGLETLYYEGDARFTVPVTVSGSTSKAAEIPFEITFQACGNGICLRPFTEKINVRITDR